MIATVPRGNMGSHSTRRASGPDSCLVRAMPLADMVPRIAGGHDFACQPSLKCFTPSDLARIKSLLERSFGKMLVEGYLDSDDFRGVIVEKGPSGPKGVALVREIPGIPYSYLCKFATDPECRRNGVAGGLWTVLTSEYKPLVWRVAQGNTCANEWYVKRGAQGPVQVGKWNVYWLDVRDTEAANLAPVVAGIPETFVAAK